MSKRAVWLLILPAWLGCEAIATFDRDKIGAMTVPPTVLPNPPRIDAGPGDGGLDGDVDEPDGEVDPDADLADAELGDAELTDAAVDAGAAGDDAALPFDAGVMPDDAGMEMMLDAGSPDAGMDAGMDAGSLDATSPDADAEPDAAGDAGADASDADLDASSDAADAQDADVSS